MCFPDAQFVGFTQIQEKEVIPFTRKYGTEFISLSQIAKIANIFFPKKIHFWKIYLVQTFKLFV